MMFHNEIITVQYTEKECIKEILPFKDLFN
jgi:hypothetical protein